MSSIAMPESALPKVVSRPKIHRLPASVRPEPVAVPEKPFSPVRFLLLWGGVFAGFFAVSLMLQGRSETTSEAKSLPPIDVAAPRDEKPELAKAAESLIPQAISDANAALPPAVPKAGSVKSGQMIVLKGENGAIIGQMARIPMNSDLVTRIKPDVDKDTGRELLSIVGKY